VSEHASNIRVHCPTVSPLQLASPVPESANTDIAVKSVSSVKRRQNMVILGKWLVSTSGRRWFLWTFLLSLLVFLASWSRILNEFRMDEWFERRRLEQMDYSVSKRLPPALKIMSQGLNGGCCWRSEHNSLTLSSRT